MSEKQIDTQTIRSIQASIRHEGTIAFETGTTVVTGAVSGDYTAYWVEDDSQEKLSNCLRQIEANSQGMESTVTNYNDYINSVADALAPCLAAVRLSPGLRARKPADLIACWF